MKANTVGDLFDQNIIMPSQAISGTTPIVVGPFHVEHLDNIALVLKSTGTVAGTWLIEASCNYVNTAFPGLNNSTQSGNDVWADAHVVFSTITQPTGTPLTEYVQTTSDFAAMAFRLTFTPTSGAGNVAAYCFRKGKR